MRITKIKFSPRLKNYFEKIEKIRPFRSSFSSKLRKKKKKNIDGLSSTRRIHDLANLMPGNYPWGNNARKDRNFPRADGSVDVFVEFVCVRRERSAQETRSLFARRYSPWKVNTPRSNSRAVALAKFQSWKRAELSASWAREKVDTDSKKFRRPNTRWWINDIKGGRNIRREFTPKVLIFFLLSSSFFFSSSRDMYSGFRAQKIRIINSWYENTVKYLTSGVRIWRKMNDRTVNLSPRY